MKHLKYCDVPLWLQDSEFYHNLDKHDPDSVFEIPADCYRDKCEPIETADDVTNVLKVVRFWGVRAIPQSVLEYCFNVDASLWEKVFAETIRHKPALLAYQHKHHLSLDVALTTNQLEFVFFWLSKSEPNSILNKFSITHDAKFGRLDLIIILRERGFNVCNSAYCAAAQYGHLTVLEYLRECRVPMDHNALIYASRGGQLECMKYLHRIGCKWNAMVTTEFAVPERYLRLQSAVV